MECIGIYQKKTDKTVKFGLFSSILPILAIALFFIFANPTMAVALPAFPGGEGWGSTTIGGRGGTVIKVTNTNDSGSGSLRAALTASGPRIVIFTIGGTISLTSDIVVRNPYLTVAGQTAPGGGIQIRNYALRIVTHDVIIRGLRWRAGPASGSNNGDCISVEGQPGSYNVIVDHNSLYWALDEIATAYWEGQDNVTWSWNVIAEPLHNNPACPTCIGFGMLQSGGHHMGKITAHHNLFAHSADRTPMICENTDSGEVINNVMYNYGWQGSRTFDKAVYIGNHFIAGADSPNEKPIVVEAGTCTVGPTLTNSSVYVSHNIGYGRTTDTGNEWNIVRTSSQYQALSPVFKVSNVTVDDVSTLKSKLLASVGATAPSRDSADIRIINDVNNITGRVITDPSDVGGWPTLAAGTAPTDSDGDGIPDSWEIAHGLNPNNAADASSYAPSGYQWIEEYINSFFQVGSGVPPPPLGLIPNAPTSISVR